MNAQGAGSGGPTAQAPMINPRRPWIRTTYQFAGTLPVESDSAAQKIKAAAKSAVHWVNERFADRLPQAAWDGDTFRVEQPGQKAEAVSIDEMGVWALRFEHPDMPFGDRPAVPGRTWTTDIALAATEHGVNVGIRSFCASLPPGNDAEIALTRPRIVLELAKRHGLRDQRPLSRQPWLLADEDDLEAFEKLLLSDRRLPVVVLTQPDKTEWNVPLSDYVLNGDELANRCCGLAHVVQLPWSLAFKWTEKVGKPWSVYLGAVRTYMPGLDLDVDSPSDHPATYAERILFWKQEGDDRVGEAPFTDFLVENLFQRLARGRGDWGDLLFIPEARIKLADVARQKTSNESEWLPLYEEEIKALNERISELEKEAEEYSDDAFQTRRERDALKEENWHLRHQVDALRQALSERTGGKSEAEIPVGNSYDEMPEWVNRHLTGQLVLHSRALRALKSAAYEDVELVYKSLLLLAQEYRNQRLGRESAKQKFDDKRGELGLSFGRSISKGRAGEQGDEYFVRHPTSGSPRRFLEWHLRKGTTKDDRLCMGIYFFWDDDTQQVVVGSLPGHLDNRMT